MSELANTIEGTMARIDDLAMQAQMFSCGAAMNLLQLGRVLCEAKPLVRHGDWEDWVRENAHMPLRRAQEYMQCFRKFGVDQRIAQLGKSQIIALLPMSDEERDELMKDNDVSAMTNQEIEAALNAQREKMRREAMEEAREALEMAEKARDAAQKRVNELLNQEAEIPEEILEELQQKDEELAEARESARHFAELAKQAVNEKAQAERDKKQAQADLDEANDILKEQQEAVNRAQEELLSLKSAQARGETGRGGTELTAADLSAAVEDFMGRCARMPYMQTTFAGMDWKGKEPYAECLRTIQGWIDGAREALESCAVEGVIVHG